MQIGRATIAAASLLFVPAFTHAAEEGPVWFWQANCGGPIMVLEVRLDRRLVHKASIPLCHAQRADTLTRNESRAVKIRFTPRRAIEWTGYRDQPDVSPPSHPLELTLWQAGADPNTLTIGITVSDDDVLYMNTVHIAYPSDRNESEIADGLVVVTYPRGKSVTATKP